MEKRWSNRTRIMIGVLLICLLSVNLLYWGSRKEGFFCDELYSYHFTSQLNNPYLVADREDGTWLNQWHSSEYFQDYLTLTGEEAFGFSGVWRTITADVHPPVFYLLLNFSSSVFSIVFPGIFTKWSGIFVNILFFLLTIMFLWKLSKELMKSEFWSAVVCVLYGLSAGAVSTVVFVRMYMAFTCFAVLFTYVNALLWKEVWTKNQNGKVKGWIYPLLSLTAFMGIMTQYYFLVYAFFICAVIWCYSLWKRNYSFAVKYAVAMGAGIAAVLLIWPDILNDIFSGYRGEEAFGNLAAGDGWFTSLPEFFAVIDGELFGKGAFLLLAFAVVLLLYRVLSVWWCIRKDTTEDGSIRILLQKREERKEFVDYAEETLLEIIENHEQKGDLDKAIEIAEHGKEISEVISEKLEELIRKKKAEEKRKYIFEEGEELLEQLYQAAQNEDYSKISLLISSEEADTIIWSNLGIDDSISYPEENGIQMQIYIKPVYDDSVYDEERGYWYLGTGVYYGNLVNGKKEGSGWAILDFAPENSPGSYQKFDGEWKNNAPNGNGELISVNIVERRQERIVGNYTDGLENGHMVNVSSKPDIVIQWDYDSIMGVRQKKGEDLYGDGSYVYSYGIYLDAEHKNATGNPSASVSEGVKCGIPGWRTE